MSRKTLPEVLNVRGEGRAFKTEGKFFPTKAGYFFLLSFTNENL